MPHSEFDPAIDKMAEEIQRMESETSELKRTVNKLCDFAKRPQMYANTDLQSVSLETLKPDQFFGIPLARAVKECLSMRGDSKSGGIGAATVNEVYDALMKGGYAFDTKVEDNAKRSLRASLSKNTASFTRVGGNGEAAYGLRDWYPDAKEPKKKSTEDISPVDSHSDKTPINNHENGASETRPQGYVNPESSYQATIDNTSVNPTKHALFAGASPVKAMPGALPLGTGQSVPHWLKNLPKPK